jgi:hypothetical protein
LSVTVIVDLVLAALVHFARDARIGVVAIATTLTIPNPVPVAVRVSQHVRALARCFDTCVDRARLHVRTRNRFTFPTPDTKLADLLAITVDVVSTQCVLRLESTARERLVTSIECARDAVIALTIIDAWSSQRRIHVRIWSAIDEKRWPIRACVRNYETTPRRTVTTTRGAKHEDDGEEGGYEQTSHERLEDYP